MSDRRQTSIAAALFIICGLFVIVEVTLHPESMHGPVWVGQAAGGTFVLGGLAILSQANGFARVYNWLVLATLVALFAVGVWVAFGAGARACMAAFWFFTTSTNAIICRSVFGFGAVLVGIMALWQFVRIVRGKRAA